MTTSGTSEAECIALSEAVEEVLVLRQEVQNFHGTVNEDPTCSS